MLLSGCFLIVLSLLARPAAAQVPQTVPASVPADAPERLLLQDLAGAEKRLSEYRGKVVVLNFWATWCVPCRDEMPLLVRIQRRYQDRGVVVIGASADDKTTQDQIPSFTQKLGISFPIWKGATTEQMELLGLGTGLPVTAIIDQQGQLAFRLLGILHRKEIEERLSYLLADRQREAPAALIDPISEAMGDAKAEPENHHHGGVSMEGASTVPS